MKVYNGQVCYEVGKKVAEAEAYRIHLCKEKETGFQYLLLIATSKAKNGDLDRWAYALQELKCKAQEVEEKYALVKTNPKTWLNYDMCFPHLVDSFICAEQGSRRILILKFRNVENLQDLVPLETLLKRNRLRVDFRTSVWVMGKLLKLLAFAHNEGAAVRMLNPKNVLIEPNKHYVVVFDWSLALQAKSEEDFTNDCRQDIMDAARMTIFILGGNLATGVFPDSDETLQPYIDNLVKLAKGEVTDAKEAHSHFYALTDLLWKREFHPFTTKPLQRQG